MNESGSGCQQVCDSRPNGELMANDQALQIKIAHLSMLQGVIARMAGDGQSMKTLAITISAAVIAVSPIGGETSFILALSGVVALVFFWWQAAYHLHVERSYRHLYDKVREDESVSAFTMDWRSCRGKVDSPLRLAVSASVLIPFLAMFALLMVLMLMTWSGFVTGQANGGDSNGAAAERTSQCCPSSFDGPRQFSYLPAD